MSASVCFDDCVACALNGSEPELALTWDQLRVLSGQGVVQLQKGEATDRRNYMCSVWIWCPQSIRVADQ